MDAEQVDALLQRLFPICRSITGNGLRKTLAILQEYIPLTMHEVKSGARAFDWTIPKEWNITDAYIRSSSGEKIIDFKKNNLHVVNYSRPIRAKLSLAELKRHLHSLPEKPDVIPYKTSYYEEAWGFCLAHTQLEQLPEDTYEVVIDSELKDGSLTYGELYVPGKTKDEVLFSCYPCHPSMANDNLSGVVLTMLLARKLMEKKSKYSYRFIFAPETIGVLAWLSRNEKVLPHIKYGLVATCVGDTGGFTYKKSRSGDTAIDRIVARTLNASGAAHKIVDFFPWGSDERQYCSPAFNLPVGSLMRTMYYEFPQYHTSSDDLSFVRGAQIVETLGMYEQVCAAIEKEQYFVSRNPQGEPQLGKRGLYGSLGGANHEGTKLAMLWVLNLSDGSHSLVDIAEKARMSLADIQTAADVLVAHDLLAIKQ